MRMRREGRSPRAFTGFPKSRGSRAFAPAGDAFYCGGELVPLWSTRKTKFRRKLLDRACADQIVPYPPGSPCSSRAGHHAEIAHYLAGLLAVPEARRASQGSSTTDICRASGY